MRLVCSSGATFLIRSECLEITTHDFAGREIWGNAFEGPFLPLVHLRANKMPLSDVLSQFADQSGFNIIYGGGADKAATPITVRLTNVPVDTAVQLLAAQNGLGLVHRDNVLLVTTEEKAAALEKHFREAKPDANSRFRRGGDPLSSLREILPAAM
jgi:hypothetical protein